MLGCLKDDFEVLFSFYFPCLGDSSPHPELVNHKQMAPECAHLAKTCLWAPDRRIQLPPCSLHRSVSKPHSTQQFQIQKSWFYLTKLVPFQHSYSSLCKQEARTHSWWLSYPNSHAHMVTISCPFHLPNTCWRWGCPSTPSLPLQHELQSFLSWTSANHSRLTLSGFQCCCGHNFFQI